MKDEGRKRQINVLNALKLSIHGKRIESHTSILRVHINFAKHKNLLPLDVAAKKNCEYFRYADISGEVGD